MHRQYDSLYVERDNNFLIVAYYTKDTPYENEVEKFVQCCEKLKLNYYIVGYPSRGSWERNAAIKPHFLACVLGIWPNRRLVYLDIDARIREYPQLFDEIDADIGVHYRNGSLLSGTIYLSGSRECKSIVHRWLKEQEQHPTEWDQKVLQRVLTAEDSVYKLPGSYTKIFDKMNDQPVIEHMQASRRYKNRLGGSVNIPEVFQNVRIQRSLDGSYWIARKNKAVEDFLDQHCLRQRGELRWFAKEEVFENWLTLKDKFEGKVLTIVGKGPSLDYLDKTDFPHDGPVIGINEAIFKLEELGIDAYGLQQDVSLKKSCWPDYSPIFVSRQARSWYMGHPECYIFANTQLGLSKNALSVSAAIEIGKRLGVASFRLVCFDACVNGQTAYAKCVGYEPEKGGFRDRFLKHRSKILSRTIGYDVEWLIPEPKKPDDTADDTPQPSLDSPEEHREPDHTTPSAPSPTTSSWSWRREPSQPETPPDHSEN